MPGCTRVERLKDRGYRSHGRDLLSPGNQYTPNGVLAQQPVLLAGRILDHDVLVSRLDPRMSGPECVRAPLHWPGP